MSHISTAGFELNDEQSIVEAARDLGCEVDFEAREFRTYAGNLDKCDFKMFIPGNDKAYEVGFVKNENGKFDMQFDAWNGGYGMMAKIGKAAGKFEACYKIARTKRELRAKGIRFREERREVNGRMRREIVAEMRGR